MGSGATDVGNKTPAAKPGQPIVEHLAGSEGSFKPRTEEQNSLKAERVRICGCDVAAARRQRQRIGTAKIRAIGGLLRPQSPA
ncbi:MAG: hypothetical protein QOJ15_2961 [Bradyrhizobium sp.]|nr:hypothetical protein [Bradyrhizobium sp.]